MFNKKVSSNLNRSLMRSNVTFKKKIPMIPYGLADWRQIRQEKGLFVDKTKFIQMIDDDYAHSCLWSPRRTGKTLLCNQLSLFHDKAIDSSVRAALFKDTFIGENLSACAGGEYLVLNLNFSGVSVEDVRGSFNLYIYSAINNFAVKYQKANLLKYPIQLKEGDFTNNILNMCAAVELSGERISVIVDETDSFANLLMLQAKPDISFDASAYNEYVKKQGSVLREFGNALKIATTAGVSRIFMTGVTPMAFCDALPSLNTVRNLTHLPSFEGALGMKACDIEKFLRVILEGHPEIEAQVAKHMEAIKLGFNGYRTSPDQKEGTFNPQAVWYYMQELRTQGKPPTHLMDPNISQPRADNMARYLVTSYRDSPVPFVGGAFEYQLEPHFYAANLFKRSTAHSTLLSLAYYHGYLTYADPSSEHKGKLVVPNNEMRKVFIDAVFNGLPQTVLDDLAKLSLAFLTKNANKAAGLVALADIYVLYQAGNYSEVAKKIEGLIRKAE